MIRFKKIARNLLTVLLLLGAVAFAELRRQQRVCQRLVVEVQTDGARFITPEDVRLLVTQQQTTPLEGVRLKDIDLKMLERNVASNSYVQQVNAYHDLAGTVVVQAQQNRPIARILARGSGVPDAYLGADGRLLPLSDRLTARVALLSGDFATALLKSAGAEKEDPARAQVLELLRYVEQDEFWRAQIAQIDIDKRGEVTLYPQVGKQRITFGPADQVSEKFNKLAVFYDQILPRQGWNHYEQVSLKYQNQIVCQ
jgi:cell division protein FtsQ